MTDKQDLPQPANPVPAGVKPYQRRSPEKLPVEPAPGNV